MRPRRGRKYQFILKTRNASVCDGELLVVTQAICSSQPSLCTTRQTKSQLFFFSFGHTDTLCCHCCIVISCSWISQQKSRHSEHIWCFSTFKNEQSNALWEKNHYLVDLVTTLMALYNVLLNIREARKSIVFFSFCSPHFPKPDTSPL